MLRAIKKCFMRIVIALFTLLQIFNVCIAQDKKIRVQINNPDNQVELVGKLGKKLGTTVTLHGIITEGKSKEDYGKPILAVQMINDSFTQQILQIPVTPYSSDFGDTSAAPFHFEEYKKKPLPKLKKGDTYLFRAYETGEFVGTPWNAYNEAGIIFQTRGFQFSNRLVVISGKKIQPIEYSPVNFLQQNALLSGIAKNERDTAVIQSSKWKLNLVGSRKWSDSEIGKLAEVYGEIQQTETKGIFNVENGEPRLVKLEDQLGKTVKLRGRAFNMNEYWWFNYRGTDIYVEKMDELPNWTDNHYRPMEITGTLEQAKLPRIDQITLKSHPDLKLYYIVRKASWTPIVELLTPELKF